MFVYKAEFCNEEDKKIEYTMKNMEGGIESDIHYEWIKIDELEKYPLKPQKIINVIKNGLPNPEKSDSPVNPKTIPMKHCVLL